jgi:hypothetical protein
MDQNQLPELEVLRQRLERLERERSPLARFYAENRRWIRFFAISFVMTGLIVHATVPNVFVAGTPVSAAQVNQNFAHLANVAKGVIVADISRTAPLSFNSTSPGIITEGDVFYLRDHPVVGNVISSDGNVSTLTSGFQVYQVTISGWYEIYLQGNLTAQIDPANYPDDNNAHIDLSIRAGIVSGNDFIGKSWHGSLHASIGVRDNDSDGSINVSDLAEYWTYSHRGDSRKIYLEAGDHLSLAIGGSLKLPGDSISVNAYRLVIKRISL